MDLANATIDNLKTALAIDSIPSDVAKDIFKKYSSINTKDLDDWFKKIDNSVDLEIDQVKDDSSMSGDSDYPMSQKKEESLKRAMSRLNESVFREAYFDAKKSSVLIEGITSNNHYYFSYQSTSVDTAKFQLLEKYKKIKKASSLKD